MQALIIIGINLLISIAFGGFSLPQIVGGLIAGAWEHWAREEQLPPPDDGPGEDWRTWLVLGGGVACNAALVAAIRDRVAADGAAVFAPSPRLATDNAAMIARAGIFRLARGERSPLDLTAHVAPALAEVCEAGRVVFIARMWAPTAICAE